MKKQILKTLQRDFNKFKNKKGDGKSDEYMKGLKTGVFWGCTYILDILEIKDDKVKEKVLSLYKNK